MKKLLKNIVPEGGKSRTIILFVALILIVGLVIAYLNMSDEDEVVTQGPRASASIQGTTNTPVPITGGSRSFVSPTLEQQQKELAEKREQAAADKARSQGSAQPAIREEDAIPIETLKSIRDGENGSQLISGGQSILSSDIRANLIADGKILIVNDQCFIREGDNLSPIPCPTECGKEVWALNPAKAEEPDLCLMESEPEVKRQLIDYQQQPQFVPKAAKVTDFIKTLNKGNFLRMDAVGCLREACTKEPQPGELIQEEDKIFYLETDGKTQRPYEKKLLPGLLVWKKQDKNTELMQVGADGKQLIATNLSSDDCSLPVNSVVWENSQRYVTTKGIPKLIALPTYALPSNLVVNLGNNNQLIDYYRVKNSQTVQVDKNKLKAGEVILINGYRQIVAPDLIPTIIPKDAVIGNYVNDGQGYYQLQSQQEKLAIKLIKLTPNIGDVAWKNCEPCLFTSNTQCEQLEHVSDKPGSQHLYKTKSGYNVTNIEGGTIITNAQDLRVTPYIDPNNPNNNKLLTARSLREEQQKAQAEIQAKKRAEQLLIAKQKADAERKKQEELDAKEKEQQKKTGQGQAVQAQQQRDILLKRKQEMAKYKRLLQAKANALMESWGKETYSMQVVNVSPFTVPEDRIQAQSLASGAQGQMTMTFNGGKVGGILEGTFPDQDMPEGATTAQATLVDSDGNCVPSATTVCLLPGDILYARLKTGINSDMPSPLILATITQGSLAGAEIVGAMAAASIPSGGSANDNVQGVTLTFNRINLPNMHKSIPLPGSPIAVDPNTMQAALATSINRHYLLRYGSLFGTAFLTGVNEAVMAALGGLNGSVIVNTGDDDGRANLNYGTILAAGLGKIGAEVAEKMDLSSKPTTIKVAAGTEFGLLFIDDTAITLPSGSGNTAYLFD